MYKFSYKSVNVISTFIFLNNLKQFCNQLYKGKLPMKYDRVKMISISVMLSSISNAEVISSSSKREVKR